jgi:predicted DNA binding CopG/RHH family protein
MVGKSKDPKGTRITVRISDKDLADLQSEARKRGITVGAVVRTLIRGHLPGTSPDVNANGQTPPESVTN